MFIIEYKGKYWTRSGWGSKKNAIPFKSVLAAWRYIDSSDEEDTEDFSLERVTTDKTRPLSRTSHI